MKSYIQLGIRKFAICMICIAMLIAVIPADFAMAGTASAQSDTAKTEDSFKALLDKAERKGRFVKVCTLQDTLSIVSRTGVRKLVAFYGGLSSDISLTELFDTKELIDAGATIQRTAMGAGDPYWECRELSVSMGGKDYGTVTASTYGVSTFQVEQGDSQEVIKEKIKNEAEKFFPAEEWQINVGKDNLLDMTVAMPDEAEEYYQPYLYYLKKCGYGEYSDNTYYIEIINKNNQTTSGWTFVTAVEGKAVESISISQMPDKLTYVERTNVFDTTGGMIEVRYKDGTTENKPMTPEMIQESYLDEIGPQSLTVMYRGKVTQYDINVVEKSLTKISLSNTPWCTEYIEGADEINVEDGYLLLEFDNGETDQKPITKDMISGFDSSVIGPQTITVTYEGKTTTYQINIREKTLSHISIEREPDKKVYVIGEPVDVSGGKLRLTYDNGTSEVIDMTEAMVEEFNNRITGPQSILLRYGDWPIFCHVEVIRKDISNCTVMDIPNQTYAARYLKPKVVVNDGNDILSEGKDYSLSYSKNLNCGTAIIEINGMGKYEGTIEKSFQIIPAKLTDKDTRVYFASWQSDIYDGKEKMPTVSIGNLLEDRDFKVTYSDNINAGEAKVTVRGVGNYTGTVTKTFIIRPAGISNFTCLPENVDEEFIYDGKEKRPLFYVFENDAIGKQLAFNKDFSIKYENNIEPGEAKAIITGIGNYTGTIVEKFTIKSRAEGFFGEDREIRLFGHDRYDTAIQVANSFMEVKSIDKFDNIIVADGRNYADALAGSYLAKVKNAPILLVGEDAASQAKIKAYISSNIKPGGRVYILGGEGAVSKTFEKSLSKYKITRLEGRTRFETNIAILKEAGVTNEDILVCDGMSFADSLSASAVGKPILLVDKQLSSEQKTYLRGLKSKNYYIIGGPGAVAPAVEKQVKSYGSVQRVYGQNRYSTSVAVAEKFFGKECKGIALAYGLNFPDGLSGGPLAMALDIPLILATSNDVNDAKAYAEEAAADKAVVLGGTSLISDEAVRYILEKTSAPVDPVDPNPPVSGDKINKDIYAVADKLGITKETEKYFELLGAKDGAGFSNSIELYLYDENSEAYKKVISSAGYDYMFGNIKATAYNSGVVLIYTGDGNVSQDILNKFKAIKFA